MRRSVVVAASTLGVALAMYTLLLAALAISFERWDAVAAYGAASLLLFYSVTWLLRRERGRRLAKEARLPPDLRPPRGAPRPAIRLPLGATALAFAFWYVIALVATALGGELTWFHFAAIAPFAAFVLTVLTFAGRHIAFRLTADDREGTDRS